MAIVPVGSSTAYSDNTTTLTVTLPAGSTAGDTVLLHHWWSWDRAIPGGTVPTGWTVDLTDTSDFSVADTTSPNLRIYRRRLVSGDPSTVTIPTTANANNVVLALSTRGVDAASPYNVAPAAVPTAAAGAITAASITTTTAGALAVQTYGSQRYNADYLTTPDTWTAPPEATGSVSRVGIYNTGLLSWEARPTVGAVGSRTGTVSATASATRYATYALRPDTGAPPSDEAGVTQSWGSPIRTDQFDDLSQWGLYSGAGHGGNGTRDPARVSVSGGVMTMQGLANGSTGGMAHDLGQQYGRWEVRARWFPDPGATGASYHPVLIIWPDSDIWPDDGEYDFSEQEDISGTTAQAYIHYPHDPGAVQQEHVTGPTGDFSQWHNWAIDWQPTGIRLFLDGVQWGPTLSGGARTTPPPARQNIQAMPSGHLTVQLDNFTGSSGLQAGKLQIDWVKVYSPTSSGTPTVVEQSATDSFALTDSAAQELLAVSQTSTEAATLAEAASMEVVSRTFSATDSFTVTDTAVQAATDSDAVQGTAALMVDFWLLADDGTYVCPLPHVMSFQLSLIAGQPGTVNLEYSASGINADLLRAAVTRKTDALVAIRVDGTDITSLRARLNTRDEDRVAEQGTVKYTGNFLTRRLAEIVVAYQEENDKGELHFAGVSAGHMMGLALAQAQARGTGTELHWTFTNTADSNGLPWPTQTSVSLSPGTKLLDLAARLRQWGMAETEITSTNEVRMYVPESVGTHWELRDPPLILRHGRDLLEAPEQVSVEDAPTDLLLAGDEGFYETVHDDTARAERGRQIEEYISQNNIDDRGMLIAYGELELSRRGQGAGSNTYSLVLQPGQVKPLIDLWPSDWVLADTGSGIGDPDRIMQLTVESDGDRYKASVTVNDVFAERDVILSRRIDELVGGAVVAGTSVPSSDWDDGLAPAQPEGVGAVSLAYYDENTPKATLQASWGAVTVNEDGSPMSDLSGYEAQYRYQTGQGLPDVWTSFAITQRDQTSAATDSLVPGMAVEVRVQAFDRWAHNSLWSEPYLLVTATDADAPPTPSTPDVTSYLGILTIQWDGKGSAGEAQPGDFDYVEIHVSQTSGFTPDRPTLPNGRLDEGASTTYVDRLRAGGVMPVTLGSYGDTWFAKLVAVDKTGNASPASAQDSAVLVQAADGDIGAVGIGKLTAGIMSALMTISGTIRTAASGARVELDTTGFRCYSSSGTVLLDFSIPSSLLSLRGRLLAGLGIGTGATIDVNPSAGSPFIAWYPDASQRRTVIRADTTTPPSGGPAAAFRMETLDTSGQTDGFSLWSWSTNVWMGFKNTAGNFEGPRLILERVGQAILSNQFAANNPRFQAASDGQAVMANNIASVAVTNDGDVFIAASAGRQTFVSGAGGDLNVTNGRVNANRFSSNGNGARLEVKDGQDVALAWIGGALWFYPGSGGTAIKTFVIDHPTDPDRWLVHACVEGPEALVQYRGVAIIDGGTARVELPDYFEAATRAEGRQVQATMQLPEEPLTIPGIPASVTVPFRTSPGVGDIPEHLMVRPVAASSPKDGQFRLACPAPDGTKIAWTVTAVRADVDHVVAEPLRSDYDAHGDGPYRYLIPKLDR